MKKLIILTSITAVALSALYFVSCKPTPVVEPNRLPQDVLKSCVVTQPQFDQWFAGGVATENGLVLPANSVDFGHTSNCDFYQWSEQMFLWITSPATSGNYGGGKTIMESTVFYDVAPVNDTTRILVPHKANSPLRAISHISQAGPNKLPLIIDKQGRLFEVKKQNKQVKTTLLNSENKEVDVERVEMNPAGQPTFIDKKGKPILGAKALVKGLKNNLRVAQEVKTGNTSVLLDSEGNIIESELGQATGDALMAQNGSLVYYISMVNDVYAYFLSGGKNGVIDTTEFPTTAAQLSNITSLARANGLVMPDSNALAIEIKTSWVEAVNLPDLGSYITIDAVIPTYNTKSNTEWIPNGERKARLALIGMHVVGSTNGHPEMVWSTFEHINNAPNAEYQYIDSTNQVKTMPADTGKGWLLSADVAATNVNISHMKVSGDTIKAASGQIISASNTQMMKPWGVAMDTVPNPFNSTPAASNSEIISINNSIRSLLVGKDIRKNYMLIGSTWTDSGTAPNGLAYPANNGQPGVAIGTSQLANSTMETYFQLGGLNFNQNGSCFRCHSKNNGLYPSDLSHIFGTLKSLPIMKNIKGDK